jgi:histidinol-phosphate aminotransferase
MKMRSMKGGVAGVGNTDVAAARGPRARRGLTAYRVTQHTSPIDLRLDGNTGPPPPPGLFDACLAQLVSRAHAYPTTHELEARWAERLGVAPGAVRVTAGADEALDRIVRAFMRPRREMVTTEPTFEMLERYCALAGGRYLTVPWPNGPLPVDDLIARVSPQTAVIVIVTPNNPTGTVAAAEDLQRLSAAAPHAILVIDLVYGEFADDDLTPAALALPNVIVTRTLSKAWGLAGLRVGCAVAASSLITALGPAGNPYPVSGVSLALAEAAFAADDAHIATGVARVRGERERLVALLRALGADPVPSQANFVFTRVRDAAWVWDALAGLGIAVRRFPDRRGLNDALRITCPADESVFERLCSSLRTVLRPEAVLFDLDGVLADVSESYRAAIVQTAAAFGVALSPGEIAKAKAAGGANNDWELTRRLMEARGVTRPLPEVTEKFESLYQGSPGHPGLRRTERLLVDPAWLRVLGQRLPLGLVTGRPRRDAMRFLEEQELASVFRVVVTMEDAALKPDPAPVRLALGQLGVAHAWMIGDTPDDVRAARAAGVVPLGVLGPGDAAPTMGPALLHAGAARILNALGELEGLLP